MTHLEQVVDYINKNGSIDSFRAFSDLHIIRLPPVISTMRELGMNVKDKWCYKYDNNGKVETKWKEWWI